MGLKNMLQRVKDGANNRVSNWAALSPNQVSEVQDRRAQFLLEMPKNDDTAAYITTQKMLAANSIAIFNAYLPQIKDLYVPVESDAEYPEDDGFDAIQNIRYFNITKWVTDKDEDSLEKLVNVYAVLSNEECNIALVFNRTREKTNVYLAVVNVKNSMGSKDVETYKERLMTAIRGNFPGAEFGDEGSGIIPCLNNDRKYSVATASNIPTEKSEKFISQTIEKILDGVIPNTKKEEYSIVLLATPVLDVEERKIELGEFYSGMAPYASWQTDYHMSDTDAIGSSATVGVNIGASVGLQSGTNQSFGNSQSETENENKTKSFSNNLTEQEGDSIADSVNNAHSVGENSSDAFQSGYNEGGNESASGGLLGFSTSGGTNWNTSHSTTSTFGKTLQDTVTKGITNTVSKSIAQSVGNSVANTLGSAVTKAITKTSGLSDSVNYGANFGANFARASSVTAIIGKSEGITQSFENYGIKHALELLDLQMKRFEQSSALGMWDFAAYVVSEEQSVANNVAHSYLALTLGEESFMSKSAVNLWRGNVDGERERAEEICKYVRELRHPIFGLNPDAVSDEGNADFLVYPPIVSATTCLSGKELSYSLNFPQKSVSGLPVIECTGFGRDVSTYDGELPGDGILIGNSFHMNHIEKTDIQLSIESLKSHTFITGSTGSGKSNTIYHILSKARDKGIHFMVVEPAKGEYKNVFGRDDDVSVYGTNPRLTPLLRVNPFSFPEEIHVLEHLDRLVEIFNVCWPMYAAMPAVLKAAVEKSYIDCGWDLTTSENIFGERLYPDFDQLQRNIKIVIDSSEYDNENKGAYKGSLLTRVRSLTTGIYRMIFTSDELPNELLFDENVIVDLSRLGSSETKSLIMGMLVLKLQEYRMTSGIQMNSNTRHLTVLEEAHNLLKKTSTDQATESSNILGKSVEMISNAIAEMRTYGEGFIIADQSPGLMDMSVIRNTNTKIIMRLPDRGDRELVGKAASLNDDQIVEVSKFPCGVAAIYQNEWIQPVLCKVRKASISESPFENSPTDARKWEEKDQAFGKLLDWIMNRELFRGKESIDYGDLKTIVLDSHLSTMVKADFLEYIASDTDRYEKLRSLAYDFLHAEKAIEETKEYVDVSKWIHNVVKKLEPSVLKYSDRQIEKLMALILWEQSYRDDKYMTHYKDFSSIVSKGGKVY